MTELTAQVPVELLREAKVGLDMMGSELGRRTSYVTDKLKVAIDKAERSAFEDRAAAERDQGNKKALYEIRKVIEGGIFMEESEADGRLRALRQIRDIAAGVLGEKDRNDDDLRPRGPRSGMRQEVELFALAIEERLRDNDHKPHWRDVPTAHLVHGLRAEVDELIHELEQREPSSDEVLHEAADVGAYAMMIADKLGALGAMDECGACGGPVTDEGDCDECIRVGGTC